MRLGYRSLLHLLSGWWLGGGGEISIHDYILVIKMDKWLEIYDFVTNMF